jgi:hypothetical protein
MSYQDRWIQFCRIHRLPLDATGYNTQYLIWIVAQYKKWGESESGTNFSTGVNGLDFDNYLESLPEIKEEVTIGNS